MKSKALEPYSTQWEIKWKKTKRDINNPKIPLKFVQEVGKLIYKDAADVRIALGPVLAHFPKKTKASTKWTPGTSRTKKK